MNIRQLGALLRSLERSCVELVTEALAEVEARSSLRAFITITGTEALAEAKQRDAELSRGKDRGALHGIPIALKDLFYTKGIRTTGGSKLYGDFMPESDASVVRQLRKAGAISIGKTNLHELAFGITSRNPHFGAVLNPVDETRLAGGSSGGSAAAVAAGIVPAALGTDTGGSIRIPASFCGVAGLKPTYGRVSRRGVLPLAFSLDHVGPLASCVEDGALIMNAVAKPAANFNLPLREQWEGLKAGLPENFFFDRVAPEVAAAVQKAGRTLAGMGAEVRHVRVPDLNEANLAARVIQLAEFASLHYRQTDSSVFGDDVWSLLEQGRQVAGHQYINAQRVRGVIQRDFSKIWQHFDVLLCPTTPTVAPPAEAETVEIEGASENVRVAATRLVRSLNFLGEPALSMPCGKTESGLPIGLQLISAPWTEPLLLQIAKSLEQHLS